jgi:hypothetical protein
VHQQWLPLRHGGAGFADGQLWLRLVLGGIHVISPEQLYPSALSFNINTEQWFHLMPVEDIISEALLLRLRQTPKRVTEWVVKDRKKQKHVEWMCESKAEDGDDFQIYMRQNQILQDDFSCGIKWKSPEGEWVVIARYNGSSHVHTNRVDGQRIQHQCHVHQMTVEAVRQGWSHENFALPTDRYFTLEDAKLALAEDFNLVGLVAPSNQLDLWI